MRSVVYNNIKFPRNRSNIIFYLVCVCITDNDSDFIVVKNQIAARHIDIAAENDPRLGEILPPDLK